MPMRTTQFSQFPWTGGLNTSVDPSLIDPNELVQGDNIVFTTQGTRKKRPGIDFSWDDLSLSSVSRASSGLTRTLVTSGYIWKTGERFAVSAMPAAYNGSNLVVTSTDSTNKSTVTFTTGTPGQVNWTGHGLTAGTVVAFRNSGGALPSGVTADRVYFVKNPTANAFEIAAQSGGTSINLAGAGTGTHTAREYLENVITYTATTSLNEGTTADVTGVFSINEPIVASHDFWYDDGATKSHRLMILTTAGRLFSVNLGTGVRTLIHDVGTSYTSLPLTQGSMETFDNRLMVATSGQNNVMKHLFPSEVGGSGLLDNVVNESGASTPKPLVLRTHLGRLWCDDKEAFDRLHYCETGVYNRWQGVGDSGALDITPGDGDPEGLTAIFPTFKGDLIVAKRTKLYRVQGVSPDSFTLTTITNGLGCVSHNAVAAVGQDDILFVSDRGVHSLMASNNYGDFSGAYASEAIQGSVNDQWNRSAMEAIQAAYVETLNSVAFAVPEESQSSPTSLWFYNVPLKRWYRWPDIECKSLSMVRDTDQQRLYLGSSTGRIGKTFTSLENDINEQGGEQGVTMTLKTGRIFPDKSPYTTKAFKQLALVYKPTGTYTIVVSAKIDNFSTQTLTFDDPSGSDTLDNNFYLGSSVLGGERAAQAYTRTLDGYGRGITLTITQSGENEFGEILGFVIFYENAEWPQETRTGDDS